MPWSYWLIFFFLFCRNFLVSTSLILKGRSDRLMKRYDCTLFNWRTALTLLANEFYFLLSLLRYWTLNQLTTNGSRASLCVLCSKSHCPIQNHCLLYSWRPAKSKRLLGHSFYNPISKVNQNWVCSTVVRQGVKVKLYTSRNRYCAPRRLNSSLICLL